MLWRERNSINLVIRFVAHTSLEELKVYNKAKTDL